MQLLRSEWLEAGLRLGTAGSNFWEVLGTGPRVPMVPAQE